MFHAEALIAVVLHVEMDGDIGRASLPPHVLARFCDGETETFGGQGFHDAHRSDSIGWSSPRRWPMWWRMRRARTASKSDGRQT